MELYIHIPFCVQKCLYCDFLSFPASEDVRQRYVKKLEEELSACAGRPEIREKKVVSVFIGGGTPSILSESQICGLMETVYDSFAVAHNAEITIEANPGTCSRELLAAWRRSGINRLSLGLQSMQDKELAVLGRIHSAKSFLETFYLAREWGFDNINVDLMSALPGQTEADWEETLVKTAELCPEHISAYSLIIEPGTPYYGKYGEQREDLDRYGEYDEIPARRRRRYEGQLLLPGEETERAMYRHTRTVLSGYGYERYEISNYARPGRECIHNEGYWTGADYLGTGLGASSMTDGKRFSVTRRMDEYLDFDREAFARGRQYADSSVLSRREQMEEFMFLGLRLVRGVRNGDFYRRFGVSLEDIYGARIDKYVKEGLMAVRRENGDWRYALTEQGLDISNYVMAGFLQ